MGIYVFSRDVLLETLEQPGIDFGKEIIPKSLGKHRVHPYIYRGYWADVGTIDAFYDANIQLTRRGTPFNFFHPRWPIYTHPRFLPGTRTYGCRIDASIVAEGCYLDPCGSANRSSASARTSIAARKSPVRSCSVPTPTRRRCRRRHPARHRPRRVLDRVIVDKNARIGDGVRLVNEKVAGSGRRRLLHPQRHHHRSQGWAHRAGNHCVRSSSRLTLPAPRIDFATASATSARRVFVRSQRRTCGRHPSLRSSPLFFLQAQPSLYRPV